MSEGIIIQSLNIEGLRGFNTGQKIQFDGKNVLISGKMGTGKSSTLVAIEWALFGDIAHIKCSESRTQAEFVNASKLDQKAKVTLQLKGEDGLYVIRREKHAKKRESALTFTTPAGEFSGEEAANQIYSIFGTFDDFHRSIFLHQEAVREMLTENPEQRDLALDRLFGLERTRELMAAIPMNQIRKDLEKLDGDKAKIEERIKGATQQAEIEMGRAKKDALEMGLKEEDLNNSTCIVQFDEISTKLSQSAVDCGLEKLSFIKPSTFGDVSRGLKKVKETIKSCRLHITKTTKISDYQLALNNLEDAIKKLEKSLGLTKTAKEDYEALIQSFGTIEQIQEKEQASQIREGVLKNQRSTVDNKLKLISDAIDVLSSESVNNCPVCDSPISSSDVLSKLEGSISISVKEQISAIDKERGEIRESLRDLATNKKDISKALKDFRELDEENRSNRSKLQKLLNNETADESILIQEAESRKSQISQDLKDAQEIFEAKNSALQDIEDHGDSCRAIVRVLEKQAEYERIKETFTEESSQIEQLKHQIDEMSELKANLQTISDTMSKVQINLAQDFIGSGQGLVSEYYSKLCGHPFYDSIRIDVDQRNIKGTQKNTYNIKAFNGQEGKDTLISTRFSIGQMNAAALSIFLALSSILQRKSKFIIFDDPSQSLDTEHKQFLIDVLQDASKGNQLIVATQDSELDDLMRTKYAPANGYVYLKYKGWTKNGPVIESSES